MRFRKKCGTACAVGRGHDGASELYRAGTREEVTGEVRQLERALELTTFRSHRRDRARAPVCVWRTLGSAPLPRLLPPLSAFRI